METTKITENQGQATQPTEGRIALESLIRSIDDRTVTTEQFNLFLESLPKSTVERSIYRRERVTTPDPAERKPSRQVSHRISHRGDTSPMRTGRGKNAVRKQAEDNKRHPEKFAEAVQFIVGNRGKPITESSLAVVTDKGALQQLVTKLLNVDSNDRDWYYQLYQALLK